MCAAKCGSSTDGQLGRLDLLLLFSLLRVDNLAHPPPTSPNSSLALPTRATERDLDLEIPYRLYIRYISPIKNFKLQAPQGHFDRATGALAEMSRWLV